MNFIVFSFFALWWVEFTSKGIRGGSYAPSSSGTISNLSSESLYVKNPSISTVCPPELSNSKIHKYLSYAISM